MRYRPGWVRWRLSTLPCVMATLLGSLGWGTVPAEAQERPAVALPERFQQRLGEGAFLGVAAPSRGPVDEQGRPVTLEPRFGVLLQTNASRNAFAVEFDDGHVEPSVGWRYETSLVVDLELPSGLVAGIGVPFLVQQRARTDYRLGPLNGDAFGGLWLEVMQIWSPSPWFVGPLVRLTMPTDHEDILLGTGGARLLAELVAGRALGPVVVALNIGYRYGFDAQFGPAGGEGGGEVSYRVGARWHAWDPLLEVSAAIVGAVAPDGGVIDSRYAVARRPVEGLMGLTLAADSQWSLFGAAGFGLAGGQGAPVARGVFGVRLTVPVAGRRIRDPDGDDALIDRCPAEAEDPDGFEDHDGCPDPDNDADGVLDADDACPTEAEDRDGYLDSDGCPDVDDDHDGIPDVDDNCPRSRDPSMDALRARYRVDLTGPGGQRALASSAEDRDGFEDEDGCPDIDHDMDGIADWADRCPNHPGDRAAHGCPAADADADGYGDSQDRCPRDPETLNGFVDDDGCPEVFLGGLRVDEWIRIDRSGRAAIPGRLEAQASDATRGLGRALGAVARALPERTGIRVQVTASPGNAALALMLRREALLRPDTDPAAGADGAASAPGGDPIRLVCGIGQAPRVDIRLCSIGADDSGLSGLPDRLAPCIDPIPESLGCGQCRPDDDDCDGIENARDSCPELAGVDHAIRERRGCPSEDRDNDGWDDAQDACPDEPELRNGVLDADGCSESWLEGAGSFAEAFVVSEEGILRPVIDPIDPATQGPFVERLAALLEAYDGGAQGRAPAGVRVVIETDAFGTRYANDMVEALTVAGARTERVLPLCDRPRLPDAMVRFRLCAMRSPTVTGTPSTGLPGCGDLPRNGTCARR